MRLSPNMCASSTSTHLHDPTMIRSSYLLSLSASWPLVYPCDPHHHIHALFRYLTSSCSSTSMYDAGVCIDLSFTSDTRTPGR